MADRPVKRTKKAPAYLKDFPLSQEPGPREAELRSASFRDHERIPRQFTRDGSNISPPLSWSNLPEGTKCLALICDDPDAPMETPFVHWVIYNIAPRGGAPGVESGLPGAVGRTVRPLEAPGAVQGLNSMKHTGYDGPEPPAGHGTHHYHFKLYALDAALPEKEEVTKDSLLELLKGHVLGTGELVGLYSR